MTARGDRRAGVVRAVVGDVAFALLGAVLVLGGTAGICVLGARWVASLPPGESALWPLAVTVLAGQAYLPVSTAATFWTWERW